MGSQLKQNEKLKKERMKEQFQLNRIKEVVNWKDLEHIFEKENYESENSQRLSATNELNLRKQLTVISEDTLIQESNVLIDE